ncbi:hypothetical protein [Paraconexibacter algicola]|uniref:Uncharacterized protein n=1 Tax=Paraconexibacter algicola TaxID=2133960 RepID=A0A2T4UDX1_9ACTN|nr:hypothetical protein [Paraconexibacter algicola]PTL55701.1 hypothetical protein C7Y72_18900 [Paraconexibacter algicola]
MAERSLWVDPPPQHPELAPRAPQRPEPEPQPPVPPDDPPELIPARTAIAVAIGLVAGATIMAISGDWFSVGRTVSYLAAWSGAVLGATTLALVGAWMLMLRDGRDASPAVGVAALVWAGQVAALLTGLGEEALDVGAGAAAAAAGLPAALALAIDGLTAGRVQRPSRATLAAVGVGLGLVLALGLTLLPLGEPQPRVIIVR